MDVWIITITDIKNVPKFVVYIVKTVSNKCRSIEYGETKKISWDSLPNKVRA